MPKYRVTVAGLNIRSGPGTGYEVLGDCDLNQVVTSPDTKGWMPILLEDDTVGWVSDKYLAVASDEVESEPPKPTPSGKTGQDFLKLAATRIGEEYVYGANVPLDNPNWHGPWDCAEFVSWVVYQLLGKVMGCVDNKAADPDPYTGGWKQELSRGTLTSIPVSQAFKTPGAILLRYRSAAKHIVFSDGKGGTVEAMGTDYGVRRGKVGSASNWDYGILIKGVNY